MLARFGTSWKTRCSCGDRTGAIVAVHGPVTSIRRCIACPPPVDSASRRELSRNGVTAVRSPRLLHDPLLSDISSYGNSWLHLVCWCGSRWLSNMPSQSWGDGPIRSHGHILYYQFQFRQSAAEATVNVYPPASTTCESLAAPFGCGQSTLERFTIAARRLTD